MIAAGVRKVELGRPEATTPWSVLPPKPISGQMRGQSKMLCDVPGLEPGRQRHAYASSHRWSEAFPRPDEMLSHLGSSWDPISGHVSSHRKRPDLPPLYSVVRQILIRQLRIKSSPKASMRISPTLLTFSLLASSFASGLAATWNPGPALGNVALHRHLYEISRAYCDSNFDPAAHLLHRKSSHLIRESAYYAFALLLTADPQDRDRAQEIINKVLMAQDTRAHSDWRGAFLWTAEDKWETAKNPDLNSAAFVGAALASISDLDAQRHILDPALRSKVDAAGKLAVGEVMRRNVDPGYTNISLLSAGLAAAGTKLWAVPGADKFAKDKIDTVLHLAGDGAVYEYSSPTYSAVDLVGAYAARHYAFSDTFAKTADALIDHLWKETAQAYHAPTFQLGGPYNRSYGNDMLTYASGLKYWLYLALDGAYPLPENIDTAHGWDQAGLVMIADLPVKARPEFQETPLAERTWNAVGPADGRHPTRELHQFRQGNFILGTVAFQDEWKQKRNLVADWRSDEPAPQSFRVGFCIDESNETLPSGFPYASILFYSQQKGPAALVALVATGALPSAGGSSLVFDTHASVADLNASPISIQDGAITTYLYPVSTTPVTFSTTTDTHTDQQTFQVNRPWTSSDTIGSLHVISYLVVFRAPNQPAPKVSHLSLKPDGDHLSATASVDGVDLSVSFGK
jgi:hypothetical protein